MKVDPDNRLVADALEAEWNDRLRLHSEAAADYEKRSKEQSTILNETARRQTIDLAARFPKIWQDPRVPSSERKRVLRLLVEDVTLTKAEQIIARVRLSGGAIRTLVRSAAADSSNPQVQTRSGRRGRPTPRPPLRPRDSRDPQRSRAPDLGGQAIQPEENRLHSHGIQTT